MLINCVAYQDGKKLADIAVDEIDQWVHKPGCFVWVALRDATHEELHQMQKEFDLHDLAVEDARNGHQRPKVEEYDDTLFVVMKLPELRDGELETGEVAIFVGSNFVISVRNNSQQGFLGVRERCEREPENLKQGSGFVLYALIDAVRQQAGGMASILVKGSRFMQMEKVVEALERHAQALSTATGDAENPSFIATPSRS